MDMSNLSPRQRANVAGLRIKRDAVQRRYGNGVQILTTDEEAANASGWMALPLNLVNTGKQLTLRMNKNVIDTNNSRKISETSRDSVQDTSYVEDVVAALENSADAITGIISSRKANKSDRNNVVAKADRPVKSVSGVSDSDFIKSLIGQ